VHASAHDFQLVIAGDGPELEVVRQRVAGLDWVHPEGRVTGARKVDCLAVADVILAPGAVGLGVVDAFAAGVPMVVCEGGGHGPELAYLEPGVNGLLVPCTPRACAGAVLSLLQDPPLAERLRAGCRAAADRYTLEAMVTNFCDGIDAWRAASPLHDSSPVA
jgi:glycosyltransferase involved in cell wall biosynthesis